MSEEIKNEVADDIVMEDIDDIIKADEEPIPVEPVAEQNAEEIPPMPEDMANNPAMDMISGMINRLGGGTSPDYKEVFDSQTKVFEALSNNQDILKAEIDEAKSIITNLSISVNATKMYTQLLTKAIIATDVVFAIAIILILIFK